MKQVLAVLALVAGARVAAANGRPPATNGVFTHPTEPATIYVRSTFGLLISKDDGCSFHWVCEQAIGYGGIYDPKYAVAKDGTIFATTFQGLRISRDGGCTFTTATAELAADDPLRLAELWIDSVDVAANGDVWIATAEAGAKGGVYRSRDNGVSFAPAGLASTTILWRSLAVAPSAPETVYVAGYDLQSPGPTAHLYATTDGGMQWDPRPLTGVAVAPTPTIVIAAVDRTDAGIFYLISRETNAMGDRLYRTTDGGATFAEVLATDMPINTVAIGSDGVLVATGAGGTFRATDGVTFSPLAGAPQLACLGTRTDGSYLGCGTNWDPDFMAVARSSDLGTWGKMFRFVELAGPLECPGVSECAEPWTVLKSQFGATGPTCGVSEPPPKDGEGGGCCDAGGASLGSLGLGLGVALLTVRRRRERSSAASRPRR